MKIFKKLLAVILSVVMAAAVMPVASAQESYPVVFVAGYTSSQMFVERGTENEVKVWKQDVADKVIDAVKSEIPGVIAGALLALIGINSPLFKVLDPYVNDLIEYMRLNDDGTSKYDVELYPHSVEDTRLDRLKESFSETEFVAVNDICGEFRMIKSPDEIEKIKTAQSITDAAFTHILTFIKEGVTEREIAAELEYFVKLIVDILLK